MYLFSAYQFTVLVFSQRFLFIRQQQKQQQRYSQASAQKPKVYTMFIHICCTCIHTYISDSIYVHISVYTHVCNSCNSHFVVVVVGRCGNCMSRVWVVCVNRQPNSAANTNNKQARKLLSIMLDYYIPSKQSLKCASTNYCLNNLFVYYKISRKFISLIIIIWYSKKRIF